MLTWILNLLFGASEAAAPAPPTPECFVAFIGAIVDPAVSPVAFIGAITDTTGFTGAITDPDLVFIGTITDITGFTGDICND